MGQQTTELKEIISQIAEKLDCDKGEVSPVISALKEVITDELNQGRFVNLGRDFGKFQFKETSLREYNTPHREDKVMAGGRRVVKFVPSTSKLKDIDKI